MSRRIALWVVPLALAVVTLARAQTYTPPNAADYQGTISAAAGAGAQNSSISSTIPAYQGADTDLQGHAGDSVAQLQSAGSTQAASDPMSAIIQSNNAYQSSNSVSSSDGWVQNALAVQANPDATAGGTAGSGSQTCTSTPTSVTSHTAYTCDSGETVSDTTQTCTKVYLPTITSDYQYDCSLNWVAGDGTLQPDPRCTTLSQQTACSLTSQTCTTAQSTESYNYSCSNGQTYTPSTATCTTSTSASSYGYVCNENWVDGQSSLMPDAACQALGSSSTCTKIGSTCTQAGVQQTDSYSTFVGTQYTPSNASCTTNTSVSQYNYQCTATWVDGQGQLVPSAACSALATTSSCTETSAVCQTTGQPQSDTYSCYIGTSYTPSSGTCDITRSITGTAPTQYTYTYQWDLDDGVQNSLSTLPLTPQMTPYYYWCQTTGSNSSGCGLLFSLAPNLPAPPPNTTTTAAQMQAIIAAHPSFCYTVLTEQSNSDYNVDSVHPPYTPSSGHSVSLVVCSVNTLSGASISYYRQADLSGLTDVNTDFPYYCRYSSQNPVSWDETQISYSVTETCTSSVSGLTPTSTNGGYSDGGTDATACNSYTSNSSCTLTASNCNTYIDPAAAAALGLPATTCTDLQQSYTCSNPTTVNYCTGTAPTGDGWADTTTSECSSTYNGSCAVTETDYNWTRETGINNCTSELRSYTCSSDVPAADPAVSVTLSTDTSECQSISSNSACQPTGTSCAQMTTYTAAQLASMGLTANYCTQTTNNYVCTSTSPVNYTTGSPPTGSNWSCTSTTQCNASGGVSCAIQETDYSCSRTTGVDDCVTQQDSYTCSADVPAADPAQTISMSTDSSQCQSLATNSSCSVSGTTCLQMSNYDAATLAEMGKSANYCLQTQYTYTCAGWSALNSCTGQAPTGAGWSCTSSQQCQASGPNSCAYTLTNYSCSRVDGVNGCQTMTDQYDCSADVPAADPYQNLIKTYTRGTWQYSPACEAATDSTCVMQSSSCTDSTPTKTIDGVSVSTSCWQQTENWACEAVTGKSSDCNPAANCTMTGQTCLDDSATSLANCRSVESTYDCVSQSPGLPNTSCTTSYTNGQQTITAQDDPQNNFAQALAAANTASQSADSYQSTAQVSIFPGNNMDCRKAIGGLYNCCKDSGLLLGNLVSCTSEEKQLYSEQTSEKACHYVGTYCSDKSLFGVCLERKMSYCCYGSTLARIVEEAGHTQLNKDWGGAKTPDCSGFTVAQFQSLDLSNVDFSDFYSEKLGSLASGNPSPTVTAITNSLNNMAASQSSTNTGQ